MHLDERNTMVSEIFHMLNRCEVLYEKQLCICMSHKFQHYHRGRETPIETPPRVLEVLLELGIIVS